MKLSGPEAARYLSAPDPAKAGLLIFGADAMRVALKRQDAVAALLGPAGEAEMRLTRLSAAELRKDPSLVADGLRAGGFFPGHRVVLVEDATDGLTDLLSQALRDWQAGDATLVVTAGGLTGKSSLKTAFDGARNAVCIGLYDDPPSRAEIDDALRRGGLTRIDDAAMTDLVTLAQALDPGDFRQTVEKIGLYKHGDATPLTSAEVASLAPATIEAEVDDLIHAVADRRSAEVGRLMRRIEGQGVNPTTICIGALRHFRQLQAMAADPARARVFGPRREAMASQSRFWQGKPGEDAIARLLDTDLALRSSTKAPAHALVERALLRIALHRGARS